MSVMPMHCHYIYGMIDHIVHPSCCRSSWSNLHDYIRNLSKSISVSISTTTNYIFKVTVFFAVGKSVVKVNAFGAFQALDRTFAMTLSISITSFGLASIRIAIAILWNTKIVSLGKSKVCFNMYLWVGCGHRLGWLRARGEQGLPKCSS